MDDLMCNVLVIDSAIINSIGIRAIFGNVINLDVFSALEINDAVSVLKTRKINVIYLEINRNGILDFESIHKIRKIQPRVKIIIFTDSNAVKKIKNTIKFIPFCYLLKKTATKEEIIDSLTR